MELKSTEFPGQVLRCLHKLYKRKVLTDCRLLFENGEEVQAHKCVLASASGYLHNQINMGKISSSGTLHLTVGSYEDFEMLLHFMYTGKLKLSHSNVWRVKSAALMLEIPEAVHLCQKYVDLAGVKVKVEDAMAKTEPEDLAKQCEENLHPLNCSVPEKRKPGRPRKNPEKADNSQSGKTSKSKDIRVKVTTQRRVKKHLPSSVKAFTKAQRRINRQVRSKASSTKKVKKESKKAVPETDSELEQLRFQCKLCSYRFTHQAALQLHERKHGVLPSYLRFRLLLSNHRRINCAFPFKPVKESHFIKQCIVCDEKYSSWIKCCYHMRKVHRKKAIFKCDCCEEKFQHVAGLKRHRLTSHRKTKQTIHGCKICHRSFLYKCNLEKHLQEVHPDCSFSEEPLYRCQHCNRTYYCRRRFLCHLTSHSLSDKEILTTANEVIQHVCSECSAEFPTVSDLKEHIRTQHRRRVQQVTKRRFVCEESSCGAECRDMSSLRQHMGSVHPLVLYDCVRCKYSTTLKHLYQRNLRDVTSSSSGKSQGLGSQKKYKLIKKEDDKNTYSQRTVACQTFQISQESHSQNTDKLQQNNINLTQEDNVRNRKSQGHINKYIERVRRRSIRHINRSHTDLTQTTDETERLGRPVNSSGRPSHSDLRALPMNILCEFLKERRLTRSGLKDALVKRLHDGWFKNREVLDVSSSDVPRGEVCCVPGCPSDVHTEGVSLHRHVTVVHEKRNNKVCDLCGKSFLKVHYLRVHRKRHHGIEEPALKVYPCDELGCNYKTFSNSILQTHKQKHEQGKPYCCQLCDKKLKTKKGLEKHMNKIHKRIRPFICEVCGMNYGEESELKIHMMRHSLDRSVACDLCDYTTHSKAGLESHLYTKHQMKTGRYRSNMLQCEVCGFETPNPGRMEEHMNAHNNVRPHKCDQCDKAFFTKPTLKEHKKWVHSGIALKCPFCSFTAPVKSHLKKHIRILHTHRDVKPYKCAYCDYRCKVSGNCRKHVMQRHKGMEVRWEKVDCDTEPTADGGNQDLPDTLPMAIRDSGDCDTVPMADRESFDFNTGPTAIRDNGDCDTTVPTVVRETFQFEIAAMQDGEVKHVLNATDTEYEVKKGRKKSGTAKKRKARVKSENVTEREEMRIVNVTRGFAEGNDPVEQGPVATYDLQPQHHLPGQLPRLDANLLPLDSIHLAYHRPDSAFCSNYGYTTASSALPLQSYGGVRTDAQLGACHTSQMLLPSMNISPMEDNVHMFHTQTRNSIERVNHTQQSGRDSMQRVGQPH